MSTIIYSDINGNCYEELDPENTLPMECYVWIFRGNQKMEDSPVLLDNDTLDEVMKIINNYRIQGYYNIKAKFFIRRMIEEECKSPGCKRRIKFVGEQCYWCGQK